MIDLEKIAEDNQKNPLGQLPFCDSGYSSSHLERLNEGCLFYLTLATFAISAFGILYKSNSNVIYSFMQSLMNRI
jgi:hypothetical protein